MQPKIPNYVPGVGKLVTYRYDFEKHIDGNSFRHNATQIDLSPSLVVNGTTYTDVQDILAALSVLVTPPTVPVATNSTLGIIKLAGDLSGLGGTASVPRVSGLQGTPISSALNASLANGNALTWSTSLASWTSTSINLVGDVSGLYNSNHVTKINGATVPVAGSLTTGYVLTVSGPSSLTYAPSTSSSISGDVTGSLTSSTVIRLTGSSDTVSILADNLTWSSSLSAPTLEQAPLAGASFSTLTIKGQSTITGSAGIAGNVVVAAGDSAAYFGGYATIQGGHSNSATGGQVNVMGGNATLGGGGNAIVVGGSGNFATGGATYISGGPGSPGGDVFVGGGYSGGGGTGTNTHIGNDFNTPQELTIGDFYVHLNNIGFQGSTFYQTTNVRNVTLPNNVLYAIDDRPVPGSLAGTRSFILPSSTVFDGHTIVIKCLCVADSINQLVINPNDGVDTGATINGQSSFAIQATNYAITVMYSSAFNDWEIMSISTISPTATTIP